MSVAKRMVEDELDAYDEETYDDGEPDTFLGGKAFRAIDEQSSLEDVISNGKIHVYSGARPAEAGDGKTGPLLCTITRLDQVL